MSQRRCGGKGKLSAKMISWFCGYIYVAFTEGSVGVFCWEKTPCRGLTLHTRSNSPSGRTSAHLLLIYEGHHHGRVRLRCHPRNWLPHHLDLPSSNSSSKGAGHHYCSVTDIESNNFSITEEQDYLKSYGMQMLKYQQNSHVNANINGCTD